MDDGPIPPVIPRTNPVSTPTLCASLAETTMTPAGDTTLPTALATTYS